MVPKYARHKPPGQADVRLRGTFHYLGEWQSPKSKERCGRLIAEFVAAGEPPIVKRDDVPIIEVRELILNFSQHAKRYYAAGAGNRYQRIKPALRELRPMFGTLAAEKFIPAELMLLGQSFATSGDRSRQYVNRLTKLVVHVFRWGAGEGARHSLEVESNLVVDARDGLTQLGLCLDRLAGTDHPAQADVLPGMRWRVGVLGLLPSTNATRHAIQYKLTITRRH